MKTLSIYLRGTEAFCVATGRGEPAVFRVAQTEIETVITAVKPHTVTVVCSKPTIHWRRITLPFSQPSKIRLVLKDLLEDLLPRQTDEYVHAWHFLSRGSETTEIAVAAWERESYRFWMDMARKYRFFPGFSMDAFLLFSLAGPLIPDHSYALLYAEQNYLLHLMVENGVPADVHSYLAADTASLTGQERLFSVLLSQKNLPVYVCGDATITARIAPTATLIHPPPAAASAEAGFFFPDAAAGVSGAFARTKWRAFGDLRVLPREALVTCAVGAVILVLACSPYIKIPSAERTVASLKETMISLFKQAVPEATRVVDPLAQMRERVRSSPHGETRLPPNVSTLRTMAVFTRAVPQHLQVDVTEFSIRNRSLSVSGTVETLKSLENLKESLTTTAYFFDVTVGTLSFTNDKRINFMLTAKILP